MLSSALRGAGNVNVPAFVILAGAVILLPLSPAMIFGWGPFPRLGVAGGGAAVVIYYVLAALALVLYLRSRRSLLQLKISPLQGRVFKDILGVGLLSAIGTVQVNLTVTFVTAAVGRFGADAIAGYGIASRLEYIQIPLLFGLGTAVVTMVGINIGAEQLARARRIAWIGAALAFGVTEFIGLAVTAFPQAWLGLFSDEPQVLALGTLYLRNVAPFYGADRTGARALLRQPRSAARALSRAGRHRSHGHRGLHWLVGGGLARRQSRHAVPDHCARSGHVWCSYRGCHARRRWGRRPATPPLVQTGQAE